MTASTVQPLKKLQSHPIRGLRYLLRWAEFRFRPAETEEKLKKDAQQYWNAQGNELHRQYSHRRGAGIFTDDDLWLALGKKNLEPLRFARSLWSLQKLAASSDATLKTSIRLRVKFI